MAVTYAEQELIGGDMGRKGEGKAGGGRRRQGRRREGRVPRVCPTHF